MLLAALGCFGEAPNAEAGDYFSNSLLAPDITNMQS
jgi:hypothetical protein